MARLFPLQICWWVFTGNISDLFCLQLLMLTTFNSSLSISCLEHVDYPISHWQLVDDIKSTLKMEITGQMLFKQFIV